MSPVSHLFHKSVADHMTVYLQHIVYSWVSSLRFLRAHIVEIVPELHHDHVGMFPGCGAALTEQLLEDCLVVLVVDHEVQGQPSDR